MTEDDMFAIPASKPPATRTDDHATSRAAAERVAAEQQTIRSRVLRFAKDRGPDGFIDDDLKATFTDTPESSYRKRRTELAADRLIMDSGLVRKNSFGNDEIVWVHREHVATAKPRHMSVDDWDRLLHRLAGQAPEISGWATQMLSEGRRPLGNALADLARDLRLLRP